MRKQQREVDVKQGSTHASTSLRKGWRLEPVPLALNSGNMAKSGEQHSRLSLCDVCDSVHVVAPTCGIAAE